MALDGHSSAHPRGIPHLVDASVMAAAIYLGQTVSAGRNRRLGPGLRAARYRPPVAQPPVAQPQTNTA